MLQTALVSLICLQLSSPAGSTLGAPPDLRPGQEALRAGRFDEARRAFSRITVEDPAAPEGPFFEAFHLWWRLLDHPEDEGLRLAMEERLREAGRRARSLLTASEPRLLERGRIIQGVALLLEAQSRASRGSHFSAASLVRQGHRVLTEALATRPDAADAVEPGRDQAAVAAGEAADAGVRQRLVERALARQLRELFAECGEGARHRRNPVAIIAAT